MLPFAWPRYQIYQGSRAIEQALASASANAKEPVAVMGELRAALTKGETGQFSELLPTLLGNLKAHPERSDLMNYVTLLSAWLSASGSISHPIVFHAAHVYRYARLLDSESSALVLAEGMLSYAQGKKQKALAIFNDIPTSETESYLISGAFLDSLQDPDSAATLFYKAYEQAPQDPWVLEALVASMEKNKKLPEALGYVRQLLTFYPRVNAYNAKFKALLYQTSQLDELESYLRKERQKHPTLESTHLELLRLLSQQKAHEKVIQEARSFLLSFPQSAAKTEVQFMQIQAENASSAVPSGNSDTLNPNSNQNSEEPQNTGRRRRRRG